MQIVPPGRLRRHLSVLPDRRADWLWVRLESRRIVVRHARTPRAREIWTVASLGITFRSSSRGCSFVDDHPHHDNLLQKRQPSYDAIALKIPPARGFGLH